MSPARLELYTFESSDSGRFAIEQARRLCRERFGDDVDLVTFDLAQSSAAAEQAGVLLTPTLIFRRGASERRVFGDLANHDALMRVLAPELVRPLASESRHAGTCA